MTTPNPRDWCGYCGHADCLACNQRRPKPSSVKKSRLFKVYGPCSSRPVRSFEVEIMAKIWADRKSRDTGKTYRVSTHVPQEAPACLYFYRPGRLVEYKARPRMAGAVIHLTGANP